MSGRRTGWLAEIRVRMAPNGAHASTIVHRPTSFRRLLSASRRQEQPATTIAAEKEPSPALPCLALPAKDEAKATLHARSASAPAPERC